MKRYGIPLRRAICRLCLALALLAPLPSLADDTLDYPESRWAEALAEARQAWRFDVNRLAPGEIRRQPFLGATVYVYRRHPEEVERLLLGQELRHKSFMYHQLTIIAATRKAPQLLLARVYTAGVLNTLRRPLRSLRDDVFVFFGQSPYTGCAVQVVEDPASDVRFEDPCTGVHWDGFGLPVGSEEGATVEHHVHPLMLPPYAIEDHHVVLGGTTLPSPLPPTDALVLSRVSIEGDAQARLATGVRWNLPDVVREALADGADPNQRINPPDNPFRASALSEAIAASGSSIVEALLDHGAEPTGRDFEVAQLYRRSDLIEMFCRRGFRPAATRSLALDPEPPPIRCAQQD